MTATLSRTPDLQGVVVRNPRRGFTLFESVVVLAILAIIAAVVAPTINSMYGDTPLTAAADAIKARWADAKAHAIAENRPYRFAIVQGTGQYKLAPDSPEYWDGAATASTPAAPGSTDGASGAGVGLVIEDKLPQGVLFRSPITDPSGAGGGLTTGGQAEGSSEWGSPIVFQPDGTADRDAEIAFAEGNGAPLVLRLRGATGVVTTSR
ncbi:MAG: prepilin-type N-terminal cleavage/methylation domain-containing protein [Gemmataceae bacterium]|nr:prepilin-type N-terminal cleavage/methylation domain-containing protein [Gemmataceae bacterium]